MRLRTPIWNPAATPESRPGSPVWIPPSVVAPVPAGRSLPVVAAVSAPPRGDLAAMDHNSRSNPEAVLLDYPHPDTRCPALRSHRHPKAFSTLIWIHPGLISFITDTAFLNSSSHLNIDVYYYYYYSCHRRDGSKGYREGPADRLWINSLRSSTSSGAAASAAATAPPPACAPKPGRLGTPSIADQVKV